MEQPFVSIILPVYNAKNHLVRCIESILAQTYRSFELVIINDGSTDGDVTLKICEMFKSRDREERIILLDKENEGVSITRNRGIEWAKGKYLQFVDSDDYIDPDFTENLVAKAEQTGADMVISSYYMEIPRALAPVQELKPLQEMADRVRERTLPDAQGEETPETHVYGFLPEGVMDKNTFARHLMDKPAAFYYGVMWNKLYRRDLILEHSVRCSSEITWSEDFLFNLDYIRYAETFCALAKPGYHYVQNPQSICHSKMNVPRILQTKARLFTYYKELYEGLGLYEENRLAIYKYLVDVAESTQPEIPIKKLVQESWDNLNADEGTYPTTADEEERRALMDAARAAYAEKMNAMQAQWDAAQQQWQARHAAWLDTLPPARRAAVLRRAEKKYARQKHRAEKKQAKHFPPDKKG